MNRPGSSRQNPVPFNRSPAPVMFHGLSEVWPYQFGAGHAPVAVLLSDHQSFKRLSISIAADAVRHWVFRSIVTADSGIVTAQSGHRDRG